MTDVVVVGGGPAGLAAAIAARSKGFAVIVVDAARPPIDKACGEGLMPDALASLNRLGVPLTGEDGHAFRGISFIGEGARVQGRFSRGYGLGVRRTVLHQLLVQRAQATGVGLRWGQRVTGIREGVVELDGTVLACKWVVGADGQTSRVRRWASLDEVRFQGKRYGFRQHYRAKPWTDCVEVHWGDGCQVYVTPIGVEEVGIALVTRNRHLRIDAALQGFPELAKCLKSASVSSTERGAVSVTRSLRRVSSGQVALIGDASGSVDAVTGEGLGLAFHQASALAASFAEGNLGYYEKAHRAGGRRTAMMGKLLLLMDRHAWLKRRVLHALHKQDEVFGSLLAAHVGEMNTGQMVFNAALPLGWRLLHS